MKLAAYLRVSTDRQAEHGLGLAVQEQAIRKWAKANGHRVVLWARDEGVSGANGVEDREELTDALEALTDGRAAGLIAYNLDRLARKLEVQEGILAKVWDAGAKVFTVEDGEVPQDDPDQPMRTAMRQIRGVIAQLDRSMIAKRMRDGRRLKRARGGYAGGGVPLGYRAEGRELVADPDEQALLARIRELRGQNRSLREVADTLTAEGYRPKKSKTGTWHPESLRLIVKRLESPKS
jgi:DNA invertase Pin-like site-specific DNA recombinase